MNLAAVNRSFSGEYPQVVDNCTLQYNKHPDPVEGCGFCKVAPFDKLRVLTKLNVGNHHELVVWGG